MNFSAFTADKRSFHSHMRIFKLKTQGTAFVFFKEVKNFFFKNELNLPSGISGKKCYTEAYCSISFEGLCRVHTKSEI